MLSDGLCSVPSCPHFLFFFFLIFLTGDILFKYSDVATTSLHTDYGGWWRCNIYLASSKIFRSALSASPFFVYAVRCCSLVAQNKTLKNPLSIEFPTIDRALLQFSDFRTPLSLATWIFRLKFAKFSS